MALVQLDSTKLLGFTDADFDMAVMMAHGINPTTPGAKFGPIDPKYPGAKIDVVDPKLPSAKIGFVDPKGR